MSNQRSYFDEVYQSVYRDLLRYAIIHMDRPADAEDALQNVFAAFYRRISRFGHLDILVPKAYLIRMLRREISRVQKIQKKEMPTDSPEEEAAYREPEISIEDLALDRSMTDTILTAAQSLPAESYRAFVLYYGYGLSTAEIARELNIGRDTVKVRLFRARNAIRKQLIAEENDK